MNKFVVFCRGFILASMGLMCFSSAAEDAFNILQTLDYREEQQELYPDSVRTYHFDKSTNTLYLIGNNLDSDITVQTLYIWQYEPTSHLLEFNQKVVLDFADNEYINFKIVAKIDDKLIISNQDNLDSSNYLSSIDLNDGFKLVKEVELFPGMGGYINVTQSSENTIFSLIYSQNAIIATHCTVNVTDITCQDVQGELPDLSNFTTSAFYRTYFLVGFNQFLFEISDSNTGIAKAYIFRFDEFGNIFLLNDISLPSNVRLKGITALSTKSELFIYSGNTNLYPDKHYIYENDQWSDSGFTPGRGVEDINLPVQFVADIDYGLGPTCRAIIYSKEKLSLHYTNQTRNLLAMSECILIEEEYGLSIAQSAKIIQSFQLANTLPITQLDSLNSFEWTQDQYNEINLKNYYTNPSQLTIKGLPAPLTFDGEKITGKPGKKDLFVPSSGGNYEMIDRSRVEVFSGTKLLTSFFIHFKNINDAPELISPLSKEYLKAGGSYEIAMQDLVWDPDYDSPLIYTFANLPPNSIVDDYGGLQIISAKTGKYSIGVTVNDGQGGILKFPLEVEVNSNGSEGGSSGGSIGVNVLVFLFVLLLLRSNTALLLQRRKR
ncbi:hypothetical protein ACROAE_12400 [Shewanella sp. MF05960]|uniref:hypothetical protein n=1 Tax=Shewanella sp. MF05960 TaxID=3434874 RepID=UPI003D7A2B53